MYGLCGYFSDGYLEVNKNALSSVESRLLGDEF